MASRPAETASRDVNLVSRLEKTVSRLEVSRRLTVFAVAPPVG